MSSWPLARRRLALLAVLLAAVTAAFVGAVGESGRYSLGAGLYLAVAAGAVFAPAAITLQVITGQVLLAGLLVGQGLTAGLLLAPAVGGVVATAEILARVARLDTPVRLSHEVRTDVQRTAVAALAAGGVFLVVLLVVAMAGGLPGPRGLLAVGLSAGACLALATWLAKGTVLGR